MNGTQRDQAGAAAQRIDPRIGLPYSL